MKNSELIARLIYGTWIGPAFEPGENAQEDAQFKAFTAALELYAKETREEENKEDFLNLFRTRAAVVAPYSKTIQMKDLMPQHAKTTEEQEEDPGPDPSAASGESSISLEEPEKEDAPDTHTHTPAGPSDGEEKQPGAFAGRNSGEKRAIFDRLAAFIGARGPGTRRRLAEASNGALKLEDVLNMTQAMQMPIAKWRILNGAMDWIEQQEKAT